MKFQFTFTDESPQRTFILFGMFRGTHRVNGFTPQSDESRQICIRIMKCFGRRLIGEGKQQVTKGGSLITN